MEEQPQLVGCGPGARRAISGEMGFPGLDVIFRLASPAIDLFVEPAWRALFEVGDDKAGVGTLVADFDPGDDPLDAAPAFRAVVKGLEAARFAIVGRCLEARFGAGFKIGDMAAQCRCLLRDNQGENARQRVTWTPLRGSLRIREVGVPS